MDDVQGYQGDDIYQDESGYSQYNGGQYGEENPYPEESPVYPENTPYQDTGQDYQYDYGQYGEESPYPEESPVYPENTPYQDTGQDYQYQGGAYGESGESYRDEGTGYDEEYAVASWWDDTRISSGLIWLSHLAGILGIALGIFGIITAGGSIKDGAYQGLHYAVPLMVGAVGVLLFARYSIFHRSDAARSGENPDESYFQKEAGFANLAIGLVALLVFFGGWGTGAEVSITLIYAFYSAMALVLSFLRRVELDELDRGVILHLAIWLVCTGFLFFFGFTAASPAHLSPF